jgi:hypothetical protein
MEIARMDYRFTAILILMLTALAFCATLHILETNILMTAALGVVR